MKKILGGLFLSGILFWMSGREVVKVWVSENPYWSAGIAIVLVLLVVFGLLGWGSEEERRRKEEKDAQEFIDRIRGQQGHMTTGCFRVRGHFR
jgi:hypothetical protein